MVSMMMWRTLLSMSGAALMHAVSGFSQAKAASTLICCNMHAAQLTIPVPVYMCDAVGNG